MSYQIPRARQLYRQDINAAVIAVQIEVQKATGEPNAFNINPGWWDANVGNNGTAEQILDRFDQAYARDFATKINAKIAEKQT